MNSWIAKALSLGLIFASLTVAQLPITAPAYADKLYPVDEGAKEPSFNNFRQQLRSAIKRRDTKFILNRLDPNISVSFGVCGSGIKCFKELWQPQKPSSELWHELSKVIELGGTFENNENGKLFCAPYVFTKFPRQVEGKEVEGVPEYSVITGKDVNVRSRPSLKAPVVATLSYDIVKTIFEENSNNSNWVKIATPIPGYVSNQFVRHPIDYRACFQINKGRWVMTVFIAGD